MILLDGKTLSQKIISQLKEEINSLNLKPRLDIILVGNDPSSLKYVEMKQKTAESIGINGHVHHLDQNSTTADVLTLVNQFNQDSNVTAFMIQLPLPPQINTTQVLSQVNPQKDADGLNPQNLGLLFQKQGIASATALGIIKILEEYKINLDGQHAVIIGRSPEVSIPLSALLLSKNATVTTCHTHTKNLKDICLQADILISSIGKAKYFDQEFIKPGAVIIDVGYSLDQNGQVSGDFDFNSASQVAGFITPVPGGVGPMTIASLLFNTLQISKTKI